MSAVRAPMHPLTRELLPHYASVGVFRIPA